MKKVLLFCILTAASVNTHHSQSTIPTFPEVRDGVKAYIVGISNNDPRLKAVVTIGGILSIFSLYKFSQPTDPRDSTLIDGIKKLVYLGFMPIGMYMVLEAYNIVSYYDQWKLAPRT